MDPNTLMYGLITSGDDGSYIANNYVSRDFLPDVKLWPWAYGTLGMIFNHCDIDFPFTLEGTTIAVSYTHLTLPTIYSV